MSSDWAAAVIVAAVVVLVDLQCRAHRRSLPLPPAAVPLSHVRRLPAGSEGDG